MRARAHEPEKVALYLPRFAAWTPAVAGRVHNYSVVLIAAAYFALNELHTIVHYVPYAAFNAGKPRVFARALHHSLCRVNVGNLCARFGAGNRSRARVRKQIKHLYFPAALFPRGGNKFTHSVPINRLLGEQPRMLKAHRLNFKRQITIGNAPLRGEIFSSLPRAAALFTAVVNCVYALVRIQVFTRPDNLRVGAQ